MQGTDFTRFPFIQKTKQAAKNKETNKKPTQKSNEIATEHVGNITHYDVQENSSLYLQLKILDQE